MGNGSWSRCRKATSRTHWKFARFGHFQSYIFDLSNDIDARVTKRTNIAAANPSSTEIRVSSTPITQRLRGHKQTMHDTRSPSSNAITSCSTHDNTLQASISSSAIDNGRKKKNFNKSATPAVHDDTQPKTKHQNETAKVKHEEYRLFCICYSIFWIRCSDYMVLFVPFLCSYTSVFFLKTIIIVPYFFLLQ